MSPAFSSPSWGDDPHPEWTRYYVENTTREIYDWLKRKEITFEGLNFNPGNSVLRTHRTRGRGLELVSPLYRECVVHPNLSFLCNTKVDRLVVRDRRIAGVTGTNVRTAAITELTASAVVLATGGYQSNLDLVRATWSTGRNFPKNFLIGSGINSTGSGLTIAQAAGAAVSRLDHQWNYISGIPDPRYPGENRGLVAYNDYSVWVNAEGRRFVTERTSSGNGAPWNRKIRSPGGGDNLFLCSILALNPDTGAYEWHYQTNPGETWDYNSTMDIVLADLPIGRRTIKAILHAPKNGFFYVIDRTTGKLVSAQPIAKTTWASRIDLETGRPVEIPGARYETGWADVWPGTVGAHSWHAMSYNPLTGLAYIPTTHAGTTFDAREIDLKTWQAKPFGGRATGVASTVAPVEPGHVPGTLQAWDSAAQKRVWSVPLAGGWNGGTLTTAGNLVFHGRADGKIAALEARTGEERWSFDVGLGISAPPITYQVGDTQYIALLVGWGGVGAGQRGSERGWSYGVHTRRLVSFSLHGSAKLPVQPPPTFVVPLQPPGFTVDPGLAIEGGKLWGNFCVQCHGAAPSRAAWDPTCARRRYCSISAR